MSAIEVIALLIAMAVIVGMVWALIDSHSICRKTMALVRDLDRAWGIDNGEECK